MSYTIDAQGAPRPSDFWVGKAAAVENDLS